MTEELKTLKDLQEKYKEDFQTDDRAVWTIFLVCSELRQEAIKWCNNFDRLIKETDNTSYIAQFLNTKRNFMAFFNITEEELSK